MASPSLFKGTEDYNKYSALMRVHLLLSGEVPKGMPCSLALSHNAFYMLSVLIAMLD